MDCDASPREQQRARQSHSQQPDIVGPLVGTTKLLTRCISLSYKWVGQGGSQLDIVGPTKLTKYKLSLNVASVINKCCLNKTVASNISKCPLN